MFEGPISNKDALGKKYLFDFFIIKKILIFMFEDPISNNNENINIAPTPLAWDAAGKKYYFQFL